MTPVLQGRWQTRTFLMATIGVVVTALFAYAYNDYQTPFALLFYVWLVGLAMDTVYNVIQKKRWEHDWIPLQHILTGALEGALLWIVSRVVSLPGVADDLTFVKFIAHYSTVFVFIYAVMWGPMKVLFPQWRFRGGIIW